MVDLTEDVDDPNRIPTVDEIASCLTSPMWKANFKDAINRTPKASRSNTRKAWTSFLNRLCNLPYLAQYAVNRKLTREEKNKKNTACGIMAKMVYGVLWHIRFIIPGIRQKGAEESNDTVPPHAASNGMVMPCLTEEINNGIRGVANSKRRSLAYEVSLLLNSLRTFYVHFTYILRTFYVHFTYILPHFTYILRTFYVHFTYILRTFH